MTVKSLLLLVGLVAIGSALRAAEPNLTTPEPTLADAKYGPHVRNALDFWKAPSDKPTPLIVYIHGGGFLNGDKSGVRKDTIIAESLKQGISFAAINYRYRTAA
ncbi:MAG: carboxylesterase family protein, partial [Pirellulales bacterium]